jgi:hypothetical protein
MAGYVHQPGVEEDSVGHSLFCESPYFLEQVQEDRCMQKPEVGQLCEIGVCWAVTDQVEMARTARYW